MLQPATSKLASFMDFLLSRYVIVAHVKKHVIVVRGIIILNLISWRTSTTD